MRKTRTFIIALVLGVATSIAVSWFFAWRGAPLRFDGYGKRRVREASRDPFPLKWYAMRERGLGVRRVRVMVDTGNEAPEPYEAAFEQIAGSAHVCEALHRNADRLFTRLADFYDYSLTMFGWPFAAMSSEQPFSKDRAYLRMILVSDFGPGPSQREPADPQFPEPADPLRQSWTIQIRGHELPTRPLWLGMAANSTLYGVLWFGLLAGPSLSRRFVRRRRGQCTRCGYDLAGLAVGARCPECGGAPSSPTTD